MNNVYICVRINSVVYYTLCAESTSMCSFHTPLFRNDFVMERRPPPLPNLVCMLYAAHTNAHIHSIHYWFYRERADVFEHACCSAHGTFPGAYPPAKLSPRLQSELSYELSDCDNRGRVHLCGVTIEVCWFVMRLIWLREHMDV